MTDIPQTPHFILDHQVMIDEVNSLNKEVSIYWPNTIAAYSVKTNSLPYLAKMLNEMGVYAEVVSEDEYEMVRICGYKPKHIVCNGPIKSRDFVAQLMNNNVMFNINSHAQL